MVLGAPTTANIILWQWLNQTYSAGVNYANRNASSNLSLQKLGGVYMAAVTASISVGLGTKRALKPFEKHFKGGRALFLNFLVSFLAVGSAGCINVILMRSKEIQEGIMLKDEDGQELGKSKIIGKKAVF